jgi:hypothetical protein
LHQEAFGGIWRESSTMYTEAIQTWYNDIVKCLLKLKVLLLKHGKCSACEDQGQRKHCQTCFDTRLEPEVLEAITALDLAEKFQESSKRSFEDISDDNYERPPEGNYFHHVIQTKEKLEKLYLSYVNDGTALRDEKEIVRRLLTELAYKDKEDHPVMAKRKKPLTIDSIDVDNDQELDKFLAQVHAVGDKICHEQVQEAIRLGIIDDKGNLLKKEIPEDMREGADRDFGG